MIMENEAYKNSQLDPYLKNSILGTAKLAGITAILSIAGTIVAAITSLSKPKSTAAKEGFGDSAIFNFEGSSIFSVMISLIINGLLFYYLFRFLKMSRRAVQNDHNHLLASGFYSLAAYFRIVSILLILSSVLIALAALGMAAGKTFN